MKTLNAAILSAALALPCSGFANLIVNGDFQSGNSDFTSAYNYIAPAGQGSLYPEGAYTVDTNPNNVHNLWASFGDHTSGTGNMMIVNGAGSPVTVWNGTLSSALVTGQTYKFSAWVANSYPPPAVEGTIPVAAALLQFSVGGIGQIGSSYTATGVGVWHQFSATFVAGTTPISVLDLVTTAGGNDFALDDISLVAVPEPTTMVAGALLLVALGVSTLRSARNSRSAQSTPV